MDKMPCNNTESSSPSDFNDNNVLQLSLLVEQQQLATESVGPRRFCDDVFFDVLRFLRRKEHAPVRLASRRLFWISYAACAPYAVPRLEISARALPAADGVPRMIANSMRVHPTSGGDSYEVEFPSVEPPVDIVHLTELEIYDFIGPELLQFLRISARLLHKCHMAFDDFDEFVRHHTTDFITRFFALFPSGYNRSVVLRRFSSLAVPLFTDHPTMFGCASLIVVCLDTFSLDAFQNWLHLDEGKPVQWWQKRRNLGILFPSGSELQVDNVHRFIHQLRQHFLSATSCCHFHVEIRWFGEPHSVELDPFVEDNERTGEQLEFNWHYEYCQIYSIERRWRESTTEEGDREAETEEIIRITTQIDKETKVYIGKVVQGDK